MKTLLSSLWRDHLLKKRFPEWFYWTGEFLLRFKPVTKASEEKASPTFQFLLAEHNLILDKLFNMIGTNNIDHNSSRSSWRMDGYGRNNRIGPTRSQ